MAQELKHARKAAILAKELSVEKLKHAATLKQLQETEQKLEDELKRKGEKIQQIDRREDLAKAELAATVAKENGGIPVDRKCMNFAFSELQNPDDIPHSVGTLTHHMAQFSKAQNPNDMPHLVGTLTHEMAQVSKAQGAEESLLAEDHSDVNLKWLKCHDYILCHNERALDTKLTVIAKDPKNKIFKLVKVPGANRWKYGRLEDKRSKVTPVGKIAMLGMVDDVYRLHRAGLSLNGKFSLDDFFWMRNKKVKLKPELKRMACERTPESVRKDYLTLHDCILQMLEQSDGAIPCDLEFFLDLMAKKEPDELLIRYNVCLMDEVAKRFHFITMFDRMFQLKKKGKFDSTAAFKFITAAYRDWTADLCDNIYVREAFETHRSLSKKEYFKGPMDMLTIVSMMESPGVFSQFQAGMYCQANIEIEFPHLMRAMRA